MPATAVTETIEPTLPVAGPALGAAWALVPLAALVALAACCALFVRRRREAGATRPPLADLAWVVPQFVLLALATVACPLAAAGASPWALVGLSLVALAAGALTLRARLPRDAEDAAAGADATDEADAGSAGASDDAADTADDADTPVRGPRALLGRLARALPPRAVGRDALVLLGMAALAFLAVDLPWNEWVLPTNPLSAAIQAAFCLGLMLVLLLVCQGHGGGMAVAVLLCSVVGHIQYFTAQFRGQALLPGDVLAATTAAAVSTGYRYVFTDHCALSLMCVAVAFCVASLARPALRGGRSAARVAGRLALAAVVVAGGVGAYNSVNLRLDLDIVMDYWNNSRLLLSYCEQGFFPTFLSGMQSMPIEEPDGYDADEAAAIERDAAAEHERAEADDPGRAEAVAQFERQRPNVVVVMNESFADLSSFDELWAGYDGPTYFNSGLTGCALRGSLTVSVNGGGTCNSEFEFLTGNACAFIGYGKHPYATYDLTGVPNMAQDFSDMGYATTAIHPNLASNWNREDVYAKFGFDQFLDITSFDADAEALHSGLTDAETYDKVLEVLEASDEPQFVFDVTMQNHSGYDQGNIPADQLTDYDSEALDDSGDREMNEYLSCIQASDEDLAYLVDRLSQLDEPTVLVFFGDHQPYITDWFNHNIFGGDTDEILHQQRMFQTSYVVWANYDLAGSDQADETRDMSLNYLGSTVKYLVGAPLTERDEANLYFYEQVPAVNPFGYQTPDGAWHALESGPEQDVLDDMAKVQYLRFASLVQ